MLKLDKNKLFRYMAIQGVDVETLLKGSGVSYYSYKQLIKGEGQKPKQVYDIALFLGVEVADILTEGE